MDSSTPPSQSSSAEIRPQRPLTGAAQADQTDSLTHPPTSLERDPVWAERESRTIGHAHIDRVVLCCISDFLTRGQYGGHGETADIFEHQYRAPSSEPESLPQIVAALCRRPVVCQPIIMHAKVYLFARRHGPPGLSFYAATRLLLALDPYRDSPPETPPLVRDGILDAIKCVFTTIPEDDANPDPVRNILLKFLTSNHAHLRPLFQILANRYPQIMVTLVNHMSELLAVFQGDETVFCRRRRTVKTAFGLSHSQRKLMYMAMEVGLLELSSKHLCEIVDQASTRLGITLVEINGLMIKAFGECFDG